MKLSADIIADRLGRKYNLVIFGEAGNVPVFTGPEFFKDNCSRLLSSHLYLATVEHLTQRPFIESDVVLVCIGENARLNYYKEHACVLLIQDNADFFTVFQSLMEIFSLYSTVESRLLEIFSQFSSIENILQAAWPLFECPMSVLDASWQYIATFNGANSSQSLRSLERTPLELDKLLSFLAEKDLSTHRQGAFALRMDEGNYLCVNLFHPSQHYNGCLFIDFGNRRLTSGDQTTAEYLAHMIEKAMYLFPTLMENERSSLSEILQSIMKELPLSRNQKLLLKSISRKSAYYCISVHSVTKLSALPIRYLCASIENLLPGSILFSQGNAILGIIPEQCLDKEAPAQSLETLLGSLSEHMQLCIGISNLSHDLYILRTSYFQAEAALENGNIYAPGRRIYAFSEFTLEEMITNSIGKLPIEAYYPEGFSRLLSHDAGGGVSYLQTLTVFLEENMSYSETAKRLYIHRSTLIDRINRIQRELNLDLNDPDRRLLVLILIKALKLEQSIHKR